MVRRAALAALVLVFALISAFASAQGGAFQGTVSGNDVSKNPALEGVSIEQKIGTMIPTDVSVTDDHGKSMSFDGLLHNRPIVLLPIFYRCNGVCTTEMQGVLNALIKNKDLVPGRDLDVVALSLNPKETPDLAAAKKAEYLEQYGHKQTAPGWIFLTGPQESVQRILNPMGLQYTYEVEQDRVNHPSALFVLTPRGRISKVMLRGMYPAAQFAEDIRRAAKDELGEAETDTAWFGCVHVDPVTGKRSLVVQGVVRAIAVVTVTSLLALMVIQNRRKRPAKTVS